MFVCLGTPVTLGPGALIMLIKAQVHMVGKHLRSVKTHVLIVSSGLRAFIWTCAATCVCVCVAVSLYSFSRSVSGRALYETDRHPEGKDRYGTRKQSGRCSLAQ